jgi:hypothetical protein
MKHLLIGASFVDPVWEPETKFWSTEYARHMPSYIVAKAGMGIKGVCVETLYHLERLNNVSTVIAMLPNLWKIDLEVDVETYLCNAMVDLLEADELGYRVLEPAQRKWLISGSVKWPPDTEQAPIFDFLFKHQGFLVVAKEHFRELRRLQDYCDSRKIQLHITTTMDPLDELTGLDYIRDDIISLLNTVRYDSWFRFDGKFINQFLGHEVHPTTQEHQVLFEHIHHMISKGI